MSDFSIKSGEVVFLYEILQNPSQYDAVRVIGRCTQFDAVAHRVLITSPSHSHASASTSSSYHQQQQQQLTVKVDLLPDVYYTVGGLYQFIGEVQEGPKSSKMQVDEEESENEGVTIRARVSRPVDGLDLNLYEQTVKIRRNFLSSFVPS